MKELHVQKGHKKLEIYQVAHSLAVKVHRLSLTFPSFERFEEGSQIRRSSKSVSSNIVEEFALRRYKNEFVHYLFRSYGSAEETIEHLELLFETQSSTDKRLFAELLQQYNFLCGKIMRYIQYVDKEFDTPNFIKEPALNYSGSLVAEEEAPKHKPRNSNQYKKAR
ncbi:MAG: four helix bundle protein [Bacteroidota bacterium]|nr:four helix bundle protein [Bacteroidota bacterium]